MTDTNDVVLRMVVALEKSNVTLSYIRGWLETKEKRNQIEDHVLAKVIDSLNASGHQ